MKFIDLFAGVGGFHLGLERAGHECVYANEFDKYTSSVYRYHYGDDLIDTRDIREVKAEELPDFDLLCGGFPCQPFSIAGKRKGTTEKRGTLFDEIVRIARVKKPKMLLLENVKGLLSAEKGWSFYYILSALDELGYDVEWCVLNSKYFGVPQNRERVFIVGHLRGESGRQVFSFRENAKEISGVFEKEIINPLKGKTEYGWHFEQNVYDSEGIARSVKAGEGSGNKPKIITQERQRCKCNEGKMCEVCCEFCGNYKDECKCNKTTTGVSGNDGANTGGVYQGQLRRLTPKECERLQGFPDDYTMFGQDTQGNKIKISDTQRYKMMGNAVTVNVIKWLGNRLP